jgi:AraC-like DNA-binding protein
MRPVSVAELAREPVGRFVSGRTFVHFCYADWLWGVLLWGRPNEQDAWTLGRSLVLELPAGVPPHASIVDASRLGGADADAFQLLSAYVLQHHEVLGRQVTRLALVRPEGLPGAVVAGFYDVLPRPYPVETFASSREALEWLVATVDGAAIEPIEAALAEMYQGSVGVAPIVRALRDVFLNPGGLGEADVAGAARALGVSERTLQRRLAEAGTSFQEELATVRLEEARRRMLDTDASLTTIALDVGCASLSHFSALFRKTAGESPSAWRARHRRRDSD